MKRKVNLWLLILLVGGSFVSSDTGSHSANATLCRPRLSSGNSNNSPAIALHDPAHIGLQPGPGPTGEPIIIWQFEALAPWSSISVVGQAVHVMTSTNYHLLHAATGEELNRWDYVGDDREAEVVGDDLFVVSRFDQFGVLYAFDFDTGKQRWNFSHPAYFVPNVVVSEGIAYLLSTDSTNVPTALAINAVNVGDGSERWQFIFEERDNYLNRILHEDSKLVVGEGGVYLSTSARVYGIDAATGEQCWHYESDGAGLSVPAVSDGSVFITGGSHLVALDAASGERKWRVPGVDGLSSPAVAAGIVYVGAEDGSLYAFGARSGTQKWAFETGDFRGSAPVIADGTVYAASKDGYLYAVSAESGAQKWRSFIGSAPFARPVVANGVVIVATSNGLLAIGPG